MTRSLQLGLLIWLAAACADSNHAFREKGAGDSQASADDPNAHPNVADASTNVPIMGTNLIPGDLLATNVDGEVRFQATFKNRTGGSLVTYNTMAANDRKAIDAAVSKTGWHISSSDEGRYSANNRCSAATNRFEYICRELSGIGDQIILSASLQMTTNAGVLEAKGQITVGTWTVFMTEMAEVATPGLLDFNSMDSSGNLIVGASPSRNSMRLGVIGARKSNAGGGLSLAEAQSSESITWTPILPLDSVTQGPRNQLSNIRSLGNGRSVVTALAQGGDANGTQFSDSIVQWSIDDLGQATDKKSFTSPSPTSGLYLNGGPDLGLLRGTVKSFDQETRVGQVLIEQWLDENGIWRSFTNPDTERTVAIGAVAFLGGRAYGVAQRVLAAPLGFILGPPRAGAGLTVTKCIADGAALKCTSRDLQKLCQDNGTILPSLSGIQVSVNISEEGAILVTRSGIRNAYTGSGGTANFDSGGDLLKLSIISLLDFKSGSGSCLNVPTSLDTPTTFAVGAGLSLEGTTGKFPFVYMPYLKVDKSGPTGNAYASWMSSISMGTGTLTPNSGITSIAVFNKAGELVRDLPWKGTIGAQGVFFPRNGVGVIASTVSSCPTGVSQCVELQYVRFQL